MKTPILVPQWFALIFASVLLTLSVQGPSDAAPGGVCEVGDVLSPGQSCTNPDTDVKFSVNNDGSAQMSNPPQGLPWFLKWLFGPELNGPVNFEADINNKAYNFAASKRADGNWEIETAGDGGEQPDPPGQPEVATPGVCEVGDVLSPGESCTYPGTEIEFSVLDNGNGRFLFSTAGGGEIDARNITVNGVRYNFAASKRADGNWEIEAAGDDGEQASDPPDLPDTQEPDPPEQPISGVEITASSPSPLTEANLHGSVVTLTLSGRTYARSRFDIRDAVTVSGINGVAIGRFGLDRISDTKITIKLEFDGNMNTNSPLTFTVEADAIANYDGPALTRQIPIKALAESVVASSPAPLTEATLDESVVTLTLSGRNYARSTSDIRGEVTVSGLNGVVIGRFGLDRISDTEITIELEFDGNIDTDSTLTFTVEADAIANYNGSALTAEVPVKSADEWVVASTSQPLTETTLHESVVTLTLSGATYVSEYKMRDAVTVSGIQGVEIARYGIDRINDTQITIELEFDGEIASKGTLIFTIKSVAIESYSGPALKARLSVPTKVKQREKGDVNSDGVVSIQDLMLIASSFGQTDQHPADVNGDNTVDIEDLILVAAVLDADAAAAPSLHPSFLEGLTAVDIQLWLTQAQHLNLADTTSQRGIRFLKQLLAALLPQETALLANYPNPFNPETWIPYQLSKPANVTLHIYAANGQIVRTLTLGHQPAGIYESRNRAAYWDGRNQLGEPVASGIYFYTLTAGEFTATRKMLIRK